VEIIDAYHEEDFLPQTPPIDLFDRIHRILVYRKTWIIFSYSLCVLASIVGVVIPFFYAGVMSNVNQVHWIIDVVISMVMGAIIIQPLQNAFITAYQAYAHRVYNRPPGIQEAERPQQEPMDIEI